MKDRTIAEDLDETRRLCYMALVAGRTDRYDLAGTLINALKHHQGVDPDLDAPAGHASEELMDRVVAHVNGQGPPDSWLSDQIRRITQDEDR